MHIDQEEWDRLTPPERVKLCIRRASHAQALSQGTTGDVKALYQRLAFGWLTLANEIDVGRPQ
jgi:hypothetical protein